MLRWLRRLRRLGSRSRAGLAAVLLAAAGWPSAQAATVDVTTSGNAFVPPTVTIQAGDSVRWTNGGGTHNVHADDDSFRCADGCSGEGGNGAPSSALWTFTRTFDDPATIPYYCEVHGAPGGIGMAGVVTVMSTAIFSDGFESGDTSGWSGTVGTDAGPSPGR